jgi:ubiquinone/menaquinone biosynthesis C-methylase UbiE
MDDTTPAHVVTRYEKDTWSRCAESYADTFYELTSQALPHLMKAAAIGAGIGVLDVGSGPGDASAAFAGAGARITGVDFSRPMVEVARRRHPALTFHEADVEKLPFDGESFEASVANCVVHHLARPVVVFKEVSRVLKPRGRFAFTVWGAPEEQTGFGVFFAAIQAHHNMEALPQGPLFGVTDRAIYETMLAEAGLGAFQLSRHDVFWRTPTLDPVLRGLWAWGNMAALPRQLQTQIEATTRENAKAYQRHDGFVFPHSVLLGVAVKR